MRRPEPGACDLASVQAWFLGDVTGHESRDAAFRAPVFEPPPCDTIETRWDIYSSGYVARLVEACENDYPATRRILGAGPFSSVVARYVRRCPPRSYDIGRVGDRLSAFLTEDPLTHDLPFLPDLARLEWCLAEAFIAADVEPLTWSALKALDPDAVADATFRLRPGTSLVDTRWPLLDLLSAQGKSEREVSVPMDDCSRSVLVHRQGLEVRYRAVVAEDADFLEVAGRGLRLADLATSSASEAQTEALVARFQAWVCEGLFINQGAAREASYPTHEGEIRKWTFRSLDGF